MARILITGSSDGLGSLTARALVKRGHLVVLHARNEKRAEDALALCPGAETCLVADLADMSQAKKMAEDANKLGAFDAVVHNAGMYTGGFQKTREGWPRILAINTLSPYILTCLLKPTPTRLVFVSSGLHRGSDTSCRDVTWAQRGEGAFSDSQAYADTKLHAVLMAAAFARKWPAVQSNSLDPGWVPTKMGGSGATGDTNAAIDTYVLLSEGTGAAEGVSGKYWFSSKVTAPKKEADDVAVQQNLMRQLEEITGVAAPDG